MLKFIIASALSFPLPAHSCRLAPSPAYPLEHRIAVSDLAFIGTVLAVDMKNGLSKGGRAAEPPLQPAPQRKRSRSDSFTVTFSVDIALRGKPGAKTILASAPPGRGGPCLSLALSAPYDASVGERWLLAETVESPPIMIRIGPGLAGERAEVVEKIEAGEELMQLGPDELKKFLSRDSQGEKALNPK